MSGYSLATSWKVRHHRSWPKVSTLVLATSVSCFLLVALAGVVEGPADAALAALAGVDGGLRGDFVGRALLQEPAHAAVHVLGVLADDDEVDVVGPLAGQRRLDAGEQLHRPEVDVLVEAGTAAPGAGPFPGCPAARRDGPPRRAGWRRTCASSSSTPRRQDLAGAQVAVAAEVEVVSARSGCLPARRPP